MALVRWQALDIDINQESQNKFWFWVDYDDDDASGLGQAAALLLLKLLPSIEVGNAFSAKVAGSFFPRSFVDRAYNYSAQSVLRWF